MTTTAATVNASVRRPSHVPAWIYGLFFVSGSCSLIYEVVWLRMLSRMLGNTTNATSTILAIFMAGLALGSWAAGRVIGRSPRALVWYGVLEVGIGLSALMAFFVPYELLPVYRSVHELADGSRVLLAVVQAGFSSLVMLIPTALMGATLPAVCALVPRDQGRSSAHAGFLYSANTLGAVIGILAGGFVLIGEFGERSTILLAAVLNCATGTVTVLLVPLALRPSRGALPANQNEGKQVAISAESVFRTLYGDGVLRTVLICFGITGFTAMANEVVWSRMLLLYQGTSIYAFSSMVAVMLTGMGCGSLSAAKVPRRRLDPLLLFALLECSIGIASVFALHLFDFLGLARPDIQSGRNLGTLLWAPVLVLGPLAFLCGATFPIATLCYSRKEKSVAQDVAVLYSCNTIGCILGALVAGFVLIPLVGTSNTGSLMAALSFAAGVGLLLVHPAYYWKRNRMLFALVAAAYVLPLLAVGDPYGRLIRQQTEQSLSRGSVIQRHIEESAGTTTVFGPPHSSGRTNQLWVNGHSMTTLTPATKLMAHLPIWLADNPRDALIICFGMGTTLRSASRHEGLRVEAVELIPGVVDCFANFHADGPALLHRPEIRVVIDDGRNYLLMQKRQYDVITIDPAPPLYSSGSVNLYSLEFLQLCLERLRPAGVVCLWVPPGKESEVKMILRTFSDAFPCVSLWAGPSPQEDVKGIYLIGSRQRIQGLREKITRAFDEKPVAADLCEWGTECDDPKKIADLYLGDESQLRSIVADANVITDNHPYTEFPFWRAVFNRDSYRRQLDAPRLRSYLQAQSASAPDG